MKKFWVMVSAYYQRQLDSHVLQMYAEDCKDVTFEEMKWSFEQWRRGPKGFSMPMPLQLVSLIKPENDPIAEANEVTALIFKAINKFGYNQSQGAREFMGELAWSCVEGFGGWYNLCTNENLGGEATVRAQLRDMAKSKMVRSQQGRSDEKPSLPGTDRLQIASKSPDSANSGVSNVAGLVSDALKGKSLN